MKISAFSAIILAAVVFPATAGNKNEAVSKNQQLEEAGDRDLDQQQGVNGEREVFMENQEVNEEQEEYNIADELDNYEFLLHLFENSQETNYVEDIDDYEDVLAKTLLNNGLNLNVTGSRDLISLPSVHCNCPASQHYFNVEVTVRPQASVDLTRCSTYRKWKMGSDINKMLLDFGVGPAGVGDDVVFVAQVCQTPTEKYFRRNLLHHHQQEGQDQQSERGDEQDAFIAKLEEEAEGGNNQDEYPGDEAIFNEDTERELWARMSPVGFMYSGGGPCRGCPFDNHDHRRQLRRAVGIRTSASCSGSHCRTSISGSCSGGSCTSSASAACSGPNCNTATSFCHVTGSNDCECNLDLSGFLMNLNDRIRTYMRNTVVPRNWRCAGTNPDIEVASRSVTWPSNVNYGC